eukprot:11182481-Lingulodinium_polyedra.AAC.1
MSAAADVETSASGWSTSIERGSSLGASTKLCSTPAAEPGHGAGGSSAATAPSAAGIACGSSSPGVSGSSTGPWLGSGSG